MVRAIDINTKQPIEEDDAIPHNPSYSDGNGGGGNMLEPRVAKLESDVSYIKRDIELLQKDVKSIDSRLSNIETSITTLKTTIKATGAVVTVVFAFCTYLFGSYISKILDALNGLVLK
ncbi:hemolysin XhlA [Citrobacter freundii]